MAPKNELSRRQRGHHESGQICLSRPSRQKAIIPQSLDHPPQQCSARARTHLCSVHRYRKKEEYRTRPKSALRTRRTTPRYLQDIRRFRQIGEISQRLCLATSKRLHRKTPGIRVFFLYLSCRCPNSPELLSQAPLLMLPMSEHSQRKNQSKKNSESIDNDVGNSALSPGHKELMSLIRYGERQ